MPEARLVMVEAGVAAAAAAGSGLVLVSPGGEARSGLKMGCGRPQTSLLLGPSEAVD